MGPSDQSMMSTEGLAGLETPALLLSLRRLDRNITRLNTYLSGKGAGLRPHIKTVKCADVWRRAFSENSDDQSVTVSTLLEAEHAFAEGVKNILYAVAIAPNKLPRAIALHAKGADLTVTVDCLAAAKAVANAGAAAGVDLPTVIEIDSDNHRAGVKPGSEDARVIAQFLDQSRGALFRGLMTHAGGSYDCRSTAAITAIAEKERRAVVDTAAMLAEAGTPCEMTSIGSTPTALFGDRFDGVSEVRAGVYMTMDLVMAGLGVCAIDDIALSVLTSVIGHQPDRQQILIDAGWMAMSRDRGTSDHAIDQGYGLVCDERGAPLDGGAFIVSGANQEHGIVSRRDGGPIDIDQFPIGTLLRVLPNHACATAAQFGDYIVLDDDDRPVDRWARFNGWHGRLA